MDESAEPSRVTPEPELTGDPAVDAVLAGLSDAAAVPVGEHAVLYTNLHDALLETLNEEPGQQLAPPAPRPGPGAA